MTLPLLDNKFLALVQALPPETEGLAKTLGAFVRPRVLRSALEHLRAGKARYRIVLKNDFTA